MTSAEMSDYERRAFDHAVEALNRKRESSIRKATARVTEPVKKVAGDAWDKVPAHDEVTNQVRNAMGGLKALTFDPALRSVNAERVLTKHDATTPAELRELDLRELDRSLPGFRTLFTGVAALEGGGSALAVTGAQVSSTVSGGVTLSVAAAAIAADAVTSMALMGRVIGQVAAQYGYDVRDPEEEVFALGIISLGTAATAAEKAAALASLRRLTMQMMQRATWAELNQNALVRVIEQVFIGLGEKLTHRKLAQAVPVAGVLINAGLSARMADSTYRAARDVYRVRFLSDKYGLDPAAWQPSDDNALPAPSEEDVLGEVLDEVIGSGDDLDGPNDSEDQDDSDDSDRD